MESNENTKDVQSVRDRIAKLRAALSSGAEHIDTWVAARAERELASVEERLEAGMGITVAALAGGTGSGKSTLFNALTGLAFADPGDLRPTTEEASACMWNVDADGVLDMIGVRPSRRIDYHSILSKEEHELDSLVLLDLPDHDSVQLGNSALVDQTLPLVDILVWVLDPQKYADHLLHESYLRPMRERRGHMIAVVNQIDTIPDEAVEPLISDAARLLEEDGLGDIPIFAVSARKKEGLEPVFAALKEAVEGNEAVIATAHAELDAIRQRLAVSVGEGEPELAVEFDDVVDSLVQATGVPAVTESVRQAGRSFGQSAIVHADQPSASMATATRDAWVGTAGAGLPARWKETLVEAVPDAEKIRRSIGGAVREVNPRLPGKFVPMTALVLGALLGVAAIVCAALSIPFEDLGPRVAMACGGVLVAGAGWLVGRWRSIRSARVASLKYDAEARASIRRAATETLLEPAEKVLEQHREVRESLS